MLGTEPQANATLIYKASPQEWLLGQYIRLIEREFGHVWEELFVGGTLSAITMPITRILGFLLELEIIVVKNRLNTF